MISTKELREIEERLAYAACFLTQNNISELREPILVDSMNLIRELKEMRRELKGAYAKVAELLKENSDLRCQIDCLVNDEVSLFPVL